MQNLKFHDLSRTRNMKVHEQIQRAGGPTTAQSKMIFNDFQESFGKETFLFKGILACCCFCKISINLASRGDPLHRGKSHVESKEHATNQAKLQMNRTKDIPSFFF